MRMEILPKNPAMFDLTRAAVEGFSPLTSRRSHSMVLG